VGKDFGVLILEVKGWTRGMIEAADRNFFTIRQRDDRIERQQSPLRQATGYQNAPCHAKVDTFQQPISQQARPLTL
jgi:hypothetical protein